MRVLHLISGVWGDGSVRTASSAESGACFGALWECASACRGEGEHRVVLLGQTGARHSAAEARLGVDRWLRPPLGLPALAWRQLLAERGFRADRVVLWSPGLDRLARVLGPRELVVSAWARSEGPAGVSIGVSPLVVGDHVPTPHPDTRAQCRRAWSCRDDVPVVALLADPPSAGDVRAFSFVLGLTEVGAGPLHGVVSAGSSQLQRGRRFHRMSGRTSPLDGVVGSMIPRLPGCDVALVLGPDEERPSLATLRAVQAAIALSKPIVAPAWLGEHLPEHVGSLLHPTDGRMRTVLPCMMRALRLAAPWRDLNPEGPPVPTWRGNPGARSESLAVTGQQSSA